VVVESNFTNALDYNEVYDRDYMSDDKRPLMYGIAGAFTVLQNANRVINFWEVNPDAKLKDGIFKPHINHILGECYFLRAYTHFMMSLVFAPPYQSNPDAAGIIMRTNYTKGPTDYKARSTNKKVYEQIIADLEKAGQLLYDEYNTSMPEDFKDRLFKPAAQAMLARVCFVMGESQWDKALISANAVLSTTRFPLVAGNDLATIFNQSGLGQKKSETIWYTTYYFRNAWRTPRWERHFSVKDGKSRGYSFSQAILDKIGWADEIEAQKDLRYSKWCIRYAPGQDPAYPDTYDRPYYVWMSKFQPHTSNFVNLRSAELYLIRANISLKKNSPGQALSDVNALRTRAGLTALNSVTMADLEKEWIKEMAFEQGSRLLFLQANKMDVPPGDRGGVSAIPYDDPSLVWVYPENETTRNPLADKLE
jgi:starch-binding outer membrane protein, SusD/RagB family